MQALEFFWPARKEVMNRLWDKVTTQANPGPTKLDFSISLLRVHSERLRTLLYLTYPGFVSGTPKSRKAG